jgi:NDP-4-keto-2,6-dideoxyhexose 3-C-methyltransferase
MQCINCKNKNLKKIINLGEQVISSLFYSKPKKNLKLYPLDLYECKKCKLVQLSKVAPLNNMYGNTYGYRTSLSPLMIDHMNEKFETILNKRIVTKKKNKILDIGCNDGTFLNFFAKGGYKELYGIDPSAEKFKNNYSKHIQLEINFFSKKAVENKFGRIKFNLVTSFAMFYDVSNPNSFCKDINSLLDKHGIWILELSYWPMLIENLTYDQICHEHIAYYSLSVFKKIANKNNLKILDFKFNEINGGSIEITCSKKNSKHKAKNEKIKDLLKYESRVKKKTYENLNTRIENTKRSLKEFLLLIKKSNKKIIGYGASTKGNIVLNQIGANNKTLPFIADANTEKKNKFTPGTNIMIISKEKMRKMKPDYLLVLIWSFRKEVIKQEVDYIKNGGKLVFHLPILHIVDKNNYKKYLNSDFSAYSAKI